jgi:hypothetical protein
MHSEKKELMETALNALERLLRMFQAERFVYLMLTAFSFALLLYSAYLLAVRGQANTEVLVAVFGGSGLITISSARISFFFNRAFALVESLVKDLSK